MVDIEELKPMGLEETLIRKLKYGREDFAKHYYFITKRIQETSFISPDEIAKQFGLSMTRVMQIISDFAALGLIFKKDSGLYAGVKNNDEILLLKHIDLVKEKLFIGSKET